MIFLRPIHVCATALFSSNLVLLVLITIGKRLNQARVERP